MLSVSSNLSALNVQNKMTLTQRSISTHMQRLSSGLRVNSAKDDAAGVSISTRMEAEHRGLSVARRNTTDGISYIQTAEGALNEVVNGLQRIRELGIQSINDTNSDSDRAAIQAEISQRLAEFDRINEATKFNGEQVFSQSRYAAAADDSAVRDILTGLKSSWLREGEERISTYFGLTGDGRNVDINVVDIDGKGNVLANANADVINIDVSDYTPTELPNGDSGTTFADRVIAHEVVHTMQFINLNMAALPDWFTEGTAEFIHGADDRVLADITSTADALVDATGLVANFAGTSAEYSVGYLGVKYLHDQIKQAGGTGIKDMFDHLKNNQGDTFDQAIAAVTNFANEADFTTSFTSPVAGEGDDFVNGLDLTNEDTGAVGGFDADGGEVFSAESILPNRSTLGEDPFTTLNAKFSNVLDPTSKLGGKLTQLHIGSSGETLDFYLGSFNSDSLGLSDVDATVDGKMLVSYVDDALSYISTFRGRLGALQNRLDSTVNSLSVQEVNTRASQSRIVDADFSVEVAELTKSQIIQQASTSVLAQANQSPQIALALL